MSTATLTLPPSPLPQNAMAYGTVSPNNFATAPNTPRRFLINRDLYNALFEAGWIPEECELVDGEIVEKVSQSSDQVIPTRRTARCLRNLFGDERTVLQSPMALGIYDEPEPDIFISELPDGAYPTGKPNSSETVPVVEVSVSTLAYDKGRKASRYAIAGVADYWVLDVTNRRLLVYRNPLSGVYPAPQELTKTESVSPLAAPGAVSPVAELLP